MRLFVLLVVLLGGFAAGQQKPEVVADPVVAAWRMDDGRILRFNPDKTVRIWTQGKSGSGVDGKWEHDPFSETIRRYSIKWEIEQAYDLELARDFSAIRGTKKNGGNFSATRLEDLNFYLFR